MAARLAILCPGQGAQHRDMFDPACRDQSVALRVQTWLADALPDISIQNTLADSALLFANPIAQPLIVAAGIAAWEALRPLLPMPALIAGYSVGEITACHVAGALAPAETVRLAATRGRLMQDCADTNPASNPKADPRPDAGIGAEATTAGLSASGDDAAHAMLSVSGLPVADTERLASRFGLFVAIETGNDTCIVGGRRGQALLLDAEVRRQGARTSLLPIGVASHTPLMEPAVDGFEQILSQTPLTDPVFPFLAGVSAEFLFTAPAVRHALMLQLTSRIQWAACMDACAEGGITVALELGPGSALSRMMQARHPQIASRSIADFRSLSGVQRWIDHHC